MLEVVAWLFADRFNVLHLVVAVGIFGSIPWVAFVAMLVRDGGPLDRFVEPEPLPTLPERTGS